jgi:hypothetical protein
MGRRSRKRRDPAGRPAPAEPRKPRVRGEAAEAIAREQLEPLAPGEIPRAIKVACGVALVIALSNPIAFAAGAEIRGEDATWPGVAALSAVMLVAAVFMWRLKYWAVLGFLALSAITCISAAVSAPFASNWQAVVLSSLVAIASGAMFWSLIRPLARIQMPERPGKVTRHG